MRGNRFSMPVGLLYLASLCLFVSCVREMPEQAETAADEGRRLSIEDARLFFSDHAASFRLGPDPGPVTRMSGESDGDPSGGPDGNQPGDPGHEQPQPSWEDAQYTVLLGDEIIEVPFNDVIFSIANTVPPEERPDTCRCNGGDLFGDDSEDAATPGAPFGHAAPGPPSGPSTSSNPGSSAVPAANTIVRLIAGLDEAGGIYYAIVYATPSGEWLAAKGLSLDTIALSDIDTTYSGSMRYFTVGGELIGGYICEDGIILYNISSGSDNDGSGNDPDEDGGIEDESSWPEIIVYGYSGMIDCSYVAVKYLWCWHFFGTGDGVNWFYNYSDCSERTVFEYVCVPAEGRGIIDNLTGPEPGGGGGGGGSDDSDGEEEEITVELLVSPTSCDIGDTYTANIGISSPVEIDNIELQIAGQSGDWKAIRMSGGDSNHRDIARQPGTFRFKAVVFIAGKKYESSEVTATYGFPSRSKVLSQQIVQQGMAESWRKTLAAADSYGTQEFGGIVMLDTSGIMPVYRYIHHQGPKVPYPQSASISMDYRDSFSRHEPRNGGQFAVMGFHTHPPLFNYTGDMYWERAVGPSKGDTSNALPQVVQDFIGVNGFHTNKHSKNSLTQLYYYSVDRRTQIQ